MFEHIAAIVAIIIGLGELYYARQYFKLIKHQGNQNTSAFSLMGLWSSIVFGIVLLIIGIPLALG